MFLSQTPVQLLAHLPLRHFHVHLVTRPTGMLATDSLTRRSRGLMLTDRVAMKVPISCPFTVKMKMRLCFFTLMVDCQSGSD